MANLDLQIISSGDSLDDEIMNNNINVLNAVPLTGTTLNDIPTFSPDTYISAESINNVFTKIKENWIDTSDGTAETGDILDGKLAYVNGKSVMGTMPIVTQATPSISIDSSTGIITASATQAAGYVGVGTKTIEERLQTQAAKRITPSKANITAVAAGKYTTGDVIVDPVPTQSKTVTPTTSTQRITPDNPSQFLASVTVTAVPTQTKSVIPNTSAQTVTPDNGKFLSSVTVNAIPNTYVRPAATKAATTYTPTTERQIISAGTYCKGQQTIEGDADLVAGNIKSGVDIFGVSGTYTSDATADAGDILFGETAYVDGKKVTGTIATKSSKDLTVNKSIVSVPAGYYASEASKSVSSVDLAMPSISVDSTTGIITASVTQGTGYVFGGTKTNTKELYTQAATTITPSAYPQTAVKKGFYTTGVISVAPVPTQTKSATPSKSRQTVTPDSGKFLSSVTIGGIPSNYITTSDATATESDMAEGVIAYANGKKVEGNVSTVAKGTCESVDYSYLDNIIDPATINVRGIPTVDKLYRAGSYVGVPIPTSEFGNATAADVVAGKTFTSSAGLEVTGGRKTFISRDGSDIVSSIETSSAGSSLKLTLNTDILGTVNHVHCMVLSVENFETQSNGPWDQGILILYPDTIPNETQSSKDINGSFFGGADDSWYHVSWKDYSSSGYVRVYFLDDVYDDEWYTDGAPDVANNTIFGNMIIYD